MPVFDYKVNHKTDTLTGVLLMLALLIGGVYFVLWVIGGILAVTLGDILLWAALIGAGYLVGRGLR
jgi:membrane protein implicated in regulation of membrane protease activity